MIHICLICMEVFAWGKYGGFGRATRTIGGALVKEGIKVTVVVPQRENQKPEEVLDGMRVLGFPLWNQARAFQLYRQVNADIYHSQEPSLNTWVAQQAAPQSKHVITFRDTRTAEDWRIEASLPTYSHLRVLLNRWYEDGALVSRAVHRADGLFAASYLVQQKARAHYRLTQNPVFLPTPVKVATELLKAEDPTVCFVARMDRRKRPELFFDLARQFAQVKFIAVGAAHDPVFDQELRSQARKIPNLEWRGFVDQFDSAVLDDVLSKSWVMVNTAAREGLPNAFIEAAAHRCALLSTVDPDTFTSRFGFYAEHDNLAEGLHWLLQKDHWREKGNAGWQHVSQTFETKAAIAQHLNMYRALLEKE